MSFQIGLNRFFCKIHGKFILKINSGSLGLIYGLWKA